MNTDSNGSNDEILITRAQSLPVSLRPIQWAKDKLYPAIPLEAPIVDYRTTWERFTDKVDHIWTTTKIIAVITPHLFTLFKGYLMKDWKTTTTGIVKAIFSVLTILGISTGNITEALITAFLTAAVEIVQSILTPDKK